MNTDTMIQSEELNRVNNNHAEEAYEPAPPPTYSEAFPPLVSQPRQPPAHPSNLGKWNQKMAVRTSSVTQVFTVPMEERRFKDFEMHEQNFGGQSEQAKICADIMQRTGCHIEMNMNRDQSLTLVVTGKNEAVMQARRKILNELQMQVTVIINIPKDHHRFLLGRSGSNLAKLELETATKISLPRQDENSDAVRITGTKEGIDKARHEIQVISDEQAKLAFERLHIKKAYHPFICGPHNEMTAAISRETGARINVPPPVVLKDEISVAGEKEGVAKAVHRIMEIYEEKQRKCQTVSVEVSKTQHKYVIGPRAVNLSEILETTGVSVEMPPLSNPSETITLRGEPDKLGAALTLVYAKANSVCETEVEAEAWLHKFIIGKAGNNIRQLTEDLQKVHVEFVDDKIVIEGPPEQVEEARKNLEKHIAELKSRISFEDLTVDQKFHRHIIGKSGSNINRIKAETGVQIIIPSDNENSNLIRIEGNPQGVQQAKKDLLDLVSKMENEKSKDIIIEQRFHRNFIGTKGEKIREVRDKFNQVIITFPEAGKKSNVVSIRGPKQDVEKCYRYMQQLVIQMEEENFQIQVPIFKQFHKNIIGKGGATIKKIREETSTKIDLPLENSDSDVIVITGEKQNAEAAKSKIMAIQNELANIVSVEIDISHKHHNSIIGAKGRLIRSIMDECGGVNIRFPPEGSSSDKVTIRGPKEDVEKAKKQLLELATEKRATGFTTECRAKPEHHKFLIGRGGTNIRQFRDKYDVRVIFPSAKDDDQELITIVGRQDCVEKAKDELMRMIKDLEDTVEDEMTIDPKHHKHFIQRQFQVLHDIADEYGGVVVSFPRNNTKSDLVRLKGAKDCVAGAKKRLTEIVNELDAQVTIECIIPQKFHRNVMGPKGTKVQAITQNYNVQVKFPERESARRDQGDELPLENGDSASQDSGDLGCGGHERPPKCDVIIITGIAENCEQAKNALLALVPITEDAPVPFDFHRFIIGQKGKDVRRLMEEYDVNIAVPPAMERSDTIKITGPPKNVAAAKVAVADKVAELELEKEDKIAKSFKVELRVDPKYHPKIIGRSGLVIGKIHSTHDVQIQLPDRDSEEQDLIVITGYQKNAEAAKEDIMKIVEELESQITIEVPIDHRVHSRLIGKRGYAIRKVMDEFKVDIRFPGAKSEDKNMVYITGMEDDAYEAKDHLLNLEEEYMYDINEVVLQKQYSAPSYQQHYSNTSAPTEESGGYVVRDAPWNAKDAPDTTSTSEFPSMGVSASTSHVPSHPTVWGHIKHK